MMPTDIQNESPKSEDFAPFGHTRGLLQIPWQAVIAHTAEDITERLHIEVTHDAGHDQAEVDMMRIQECWDACEKAQLTNNFLGSGERGGICAMIEFIESLVDRVDISDSVREGARELLNQLRYEIQ